MVFRKQKMIDRVIAEGNASMIDDTVLAIMDNLDGCYAESYNWESVVKGSNLLWCVGKDGTGQYVNPLDCDYE